MANSEISLNERIADALRALNTDWRVHDQVSSENTHGLAKKKALRPYILIIEPGVPPICIETESEWGDVSRSRRHKPFGRSRRQVGRRDPAGLIRR